MPDSAGSLRYIVLDAMGVLYQSADDVAELLVPFVQMHNPAVSTEAVQRAYRLASLGEMSEQGFWEAVGVNASLEDDYLAGHRLMSGLGAFLDWTQKAGLRVACISNDVSRWSRKLRCRFGLSERFDKWVISADVGVRKPDPTIYQAALQQLGVSPHQILFVDDREANVRAARGLGIPSVLFAGQRQPASEATACFGFAELRQLVERDYRKV